MEKGVLGLFTSASITKLPTLLLYMAVAVFVLKLVPLAVVDLAVLVHIRFLELFLLCVGERMP